MLRILAADFLWVFGGHGNISHRNTAPPRATRCRTFRSLLSGLNPMIEAQYAREKKCCRQFQSPWNLLSKRGKLLQTCCTMRRTLSVSPAATVCTTVRRLQQGGPQAGNGFLFESTYQPQGLAQISQWKLTKSLNKFIAKLKPHLCIN